MATGSPSDLFFVSKPGGHIRCCVRYRMLNQKMKAERCPLPPIEEMVDELIRGKVFTTLDLFTEYWYVCVRDQRK